MSLIKKVEHSLLARGELDLVTHLDREWYTLTARDSDAVIFCRAVQPAVQNDINLSGFLALKTAASAIGIHLNERNMVNWSGKTRNEDVGCIKDMKALCDHFIQGESTIMQFPHGKDMVRDLTKGHMYIVPYMPTGKHGSPGPPDGDPVHWAVICGAVLIGPNLKTNSFRNLSKYPNTSRRIYKSDFGDYVCDSESQYLVAFHGWHANPNLWKYEDLYKSCNHITAWNADTSCYEFACAGEEARMYEDEKFDYRGTVLRMKL